MIFKINGKTLLLILAGTGVLTTAYLAVRNTPEAQNRKEAALAEKRLRTGDENAQLTWFESLQAQIGAYAPAIISGMATIGGLIGSDVVNQRNINKVKQVVNDHKDMIEKFDGKGAQKTIEKAIEQKKLDEKEGRQWKRKEHFRIVFQGKSIQFESTREEVMQAFYETNRYFHGKGLVTFNEFLKFLGQDPVADGDERGWEVYVGENVYGYSWIDFGLKECEDEPWVTEIFTAVYPHFFEEEDCQREIDEGSCGKLGA